MARAQGLMFLAALITTWQGAPTVVALEPGQKLAVEIVGVSTHYSQGKHGSTGQTTGSGAQLDEGYVGRSYLAYGVVNERGLTLNICSGASGSLEVGQDLTATRNEILIKQRRAHFWSAEYRVLPSEIGKVALALTWEHWTIRGTNRPVKVGGDTRHIEMNEGERHVFDYVSIVPPPDDYCASNVQIAITASVLEDPEFAQQSLAYDMWFEHRDAQGVVTRRHAESVGRQGEAVTIRAEPARYPVPEETFADGTRADAVVEVAASVRARLRQDGLITVELDASRWIGVARADGPRGGRIGGGGSKIFHLTPGETVRLTIPAPGPSEKSGIDRRTDSRGSLPDGGATETIWVEHSKFFAGSEDSIVLTVRRGR